jgi:hypothetical protein
VSKLVEILASFDSNGISKFSPISGGKLDEFHCSQLNQYQGCCKGAESSATSNSNTTLCSLACQWVIQCLWECPSWSKYWRRSIVTEYRSLAPYQAVNWTNSIWSSDSDCFKITGSLSSSIETHQYMGNQIPLTFWEQWNSSSLPPDIEPVILKQSESEDHGSSIWCSYRRYHMWFRCIQGVRANIWEIKFP